LKVTLKHQANCSTVPIAWPIAKLLDWVLGAHDEHTYKKAELKSFLQFHRQGEEPLRDEEISILNGVLSLNEKSAAEIMTPWKVSRRN
jgi:metal transporter CNNM